ncbi:MAG: IclR family transcriptional regulator [Mesorhizobium sp.]|nr:MAG: IclR family transcriptional regulator [Mesorhizobium sp.]
MHVKTTTESEEKATGTQLLDRSIAILNHLGELGRGGARVSEIAEAFGLNMSTAHRIIAGLERHRYIERDETTKRFRLGLALFALGAKAADTTGMRRVCHPALMRIAAETGDTVFLMARNGFNTVCVDRQDGGYRIDSLTGQVGGQIPLGVGPASQAILAMLPPNQAEVILETNAPQFERYHGLTADEIRNALPEIRRRGYAVDDGHLVEGISAIAVPIILEGGNVAGALAINMTSARLRRSSAGDFVQILRREIHEIERTMNPHDISIAS